MIKLEAVRRTASEELDQEKRADLGQFMTPSSIAGFMASLFGKWPNEVSLLEPGAGIGSLVCAFAKRAQQENPNANVKITAYEIEPSLLEHLSRHLNELKSDRVETTIHCRDFVREASFASAFNPKRFTHVILNPPYRKIGANAEYRKILRSIGVEAGNLYTAFLALAVALTSDGGEIVAIVPRSFCNGSYFRPFRKWLLDHVSIEQIHVFESRNKAFRDDNVLQENIIVHLVRKGKQGPVVISTSDGKTFGDYLTKTLPFGQIVKADDFEQFIHVPTFEASTKLGDHTLAELGLDVATGPVVDFRLKEHLLAAPEAQSVPLLYSHHFLGGELRWPRDHKKPNAMRVNDVTRKWLMPRGWYTITKRFSAKEEKRRIVAHVVDPERLPFEFYGFENHLNVIHSKKSGIAPDLARGLALFLNSTIVDQHFRNFSGHTQVNATDLRSMKFPGKAALMQSGKWAAKHPILRQDEIDAFVEDFYGKQATTN